MTRKECSRQVLTHFALLFVALLVLLTHSSYLVLWHISDITKLARWKCGNGVSKALSNKCLFGRRFCRYPTLWINNQRRGYRRDNFKSFPPTTYPTAIVPHFRVGPKCALGAVGRPAPW